MERQAGEGGIGPAQAVLDQVAAAWPLVGRRAELDRIASLRDDPQGRSAVLVGAAGVGKTRLARGAVKEAEAEGYAAEWVVATESAASIPLGAFAHLLPVDRGAGDLLDLLRRATAALVEQAEGGRLVLGIDDAHLLDDASAALVHQLAGNTRVFVIATIRSRSPAPDAVVSLWKDGLAERVDVGPLSEPEAADLLSRALGDAVETATVHRLWEITQGNSLFLHELVVAGLDSGALSATSGLWRWRGPIGAELRLQELVEARLERLSPEHRSALEILAVGEPLGIDSFESLVGIEAVDTLERQELLQVHRDMRREQVRLAHPLYAEVLRNATPALQARAIQRQLADAVESLGRRRREDFLRVALWRLAGGGRGDPAMLEEAARHAGGAFDFALAERLARAALDAGAGPTAAYTLGDALRSLGRAAEAEEVLAGLHAAAEDDDWAAEVAVARAVNLFFGLGRVDHAVDVLRQAEALMTSEAHCDQIRVQSATFALYLGRQDEALAIAADILERDAATDQAYVEATLTAAAALALGGRTTEALDAVDRAFPRALAIPVTSSYATGLLLAARFLALSMAGRFAEAHEVAATTYRLSMDARSEDGIAIFAMALGRTLLAQGAVRSAAQRLHEAAAHLREHDRNGYLPWCLGLLARAQAVAGEPAAAEKTLAEADEARQPSLKLFEAEVEIARAWVTAAQSGSAAGAAAAIEAARRAATGGQVVFAAQAFHDAARMGAADAVSERLAELAAGADSELVAAFAAHAAALAADDGPRLDAAATTFEAMGARLLAAEAAAEAGRAHRQAGRAASAMASAARARALLERCEGAETPALRLLEEPVRLTSREHEVAVLAARGLPSRAIAERLVISVRTVDNHLHRTYFKLGVGNRAELAAALGVTVSNDAGHI